MCFDAPKIYIYIYVLPENARCTHSLAADVTLKNRSMPFESSPVVPALTNLRSLARPREVLDEVRIASQELFRSAETETRLGAARHAATRDICVSRKINFFKRSIMTTIRRGASQRASSPRSQFHLFFFAFYFIVFFPFLTTFLSLTFPSQRFHALVRHARIVIYCAFNKIFVSCQIQSTCFVLSAKEKMNSPPPVSRFRIHPRDIWRVLREAPVISLRSTSNETKIRNPFFFFLPLSLSVLAHRAKPPSTRYSRPNEKGAMEHVFAIILRRALHSAERGGGEGETRGIGAHSLRIRAKGV